MEKIKYIKKGLITTTGNPKKGESYNIVDPDSDTGFSYFSALRYGSIENAKKAAEVRINEIYEKQHKEGLKTLLSLFPHRVSANFMPIGILFNFNPKSSSAETAMSFTVTANEKYFEPKSFSFYERNLEDVWSDVVKEYKKRVIDFDARHVDNLKISKIKSGIRSMLSESDTIRPDVKTDCLRILKGQEPHASLPKGIFPTIIHQSGGKTVSWSVAFIVHFNGHPRARFSVNKYGYKEAITLAFDKYKEYEGRLPLFSENFINSDAVRKKIITDLKAKCKAQGSKPQPLLMDQLNLKV